jgi:hypothetical protein
MVGLERAAFQNLAAVFHLPEQIAVFNQLGESQSHERHKQNGEPIWLHRRQRRTRRKITDDPKPSSGYVADSGIALADVVPLMS